MVYGELGRYPIDIDIKIRTVCYWARLIVGKQTKYSNILYRLCRQLNENYNMQFSWILFVKQIFNECGFSNIWETELFNNVDYLKCVIKQRLEDQFLQNWNSLLQNSPKAINYKTFKTEFKYEEYLNILEIKDAILLCRFRTTNNKLPIETGRWQNIPRENRKCKLCNRSQIGDEYHYIFECIYFNQKRKQSLSNYFIYRHNIIKFSELMSSKRKPILKKLCHFISAINTGVCPPGS